MNYNDQQRCTDIYIEDINNERINLKKLPTQR